MVSVDPQINPQLVRGVSVQVATAVIAYVVVACQRLYCYGKNKGGSDTHMFFFQRLILSDTRWPEAAA